LLQQIGAGTPRGGWIDAYPSRHVPRELRLDARRVARVLGVEVAGEEIARILTDLGFTVTGGGGTFDVRVPSWRVDVARDVDLIEEVARHYGYDRLPTTFPALAGVPARPNRRLERDRLARRVAGAAGFDECVTFSFIPRDRAAGFADSSQTVEILNPLSEQFAVLRPSLLSGLVDAVAHNRRRGVEDVRVFELGTVFTAAGGERRALGFAWTGATVPPHWSGPSRAVDFFDMKGVVEQVGRALGAPILCAPASTPWLVRGRAASLHLAASPDGSAVGALGLLHPSRVAPLDLPASTEIYVAELDLEAIVPSMTFDGVPRVQSPPKHPSIVRDISIVVDDTLPAADVRGTIRAAAPPTLAQVREFDRYQGAGVPDGRVSLSYRLTFQGADRTLTDAEVQRAMDGILEALSRTHRAVQR
jgi:phenylalanyl-tRNA synthetase beta chain